MRKIVASLVLMFITSANPVFGGSLYGLGNQSCVWVLENEETHKKFLYAWIAGYASGVNRINEFAKKASQVHLHMDVLFLLVLKACKENPKLQLERATLSVLASEWSSSQK